MYVLYLSHFFRIKRATTALWGESCKLFAFEVLGQHKYGVVSFRTVLAGWEKMGKCLMHYGMHYIKYLSLEGVSHFDARIKICRFMSLRS